MHLSFCAVFVGLQGYQAPSEEAAVEEKKLVRLNLDIIDLKPKLAVLAFLVGFVEELVKTRLVQVLVPLCISYQVNC